LIFYFRDELIKIYNGSETSYSGVWWFTLIISSLRRLRKEDHEFKVSLGPISKNKK
jgi:hypothetical protein